MEILEQFSETRPVLGITELSDATGINKSIVHKILQTLMEGALIARDSETRRYRLGSGEKQIQLFYEYIARGVFKTDGLIDRKSTRLNSSH